MIAKNESIDSQAVTHAERMPTLYKKLMNAKLSH